MRAVAFTIIFFIYIFSVSAWLIDITFFANSPYEPIGLDGVPINTENLVLEGSENIRSLGDDTLNPRNDEGDVIDRIGEFATSGYWSIWTILELLSGTYAFNVLGALGLPDPFVLAIKLIFPILVGFNVIYFLIGRY